MQLAAEGCEFVGQRAIQEMPAEPESRHGQFSTQQQLRTFEPRRRSGSTGSGKQIPYFQCIEFSLSNSGNELTANAMAWVTRRLDNPHRHVSPAQCDAEREPC